MGVNCGAIVASLVESELFGHLRGAFTGATRDRRGYVEAADRGTLFLDEVSELPVAAQAKLLRVLERGEVVPVGGTTPVRVDLRVLSASNRDLDDLVDEGGFRADLYARLAGYVLVLPPLSARKEDLGELIAHFVREARSPSPTGDADAGRAAPTDPPGPTVTIEPEAGRALFEAEWPLNVRELRRTIEAAIALALALDRPIALQDLPPRMIASTLAPDRPPAASLSPSERALREELVAALRACDGNVTRAAARVGTHRQQLQRWMRRLGIDRAELERET